MMKVIPTILLVLYYISNVSGRTCTCSEFVAEMCDEQINCKWNEKVPDSHSNDHGLKGKCRSLKFMQCHTDSDCTLAERDPKNKDEKEILSALTHVYRVPGLVLGDEEMITAEDGADQTNGHSPDEGDILDYPWACEGIDKHTYFDYTIDVSQIEIAAQNNYYSQSQKMEEEKEMNENVIIPSKGGSKISLYESMNGLQLVSGVVFIILVIGAMVYYKFIKKDKDSHKYVSLATDEANNYSTFNNL